MNKPSTPRVQLAIKFTLDRILAAILLVIFSPLFAVIALVVFLEDGHSPFFGQPRVGFGEQQFILWKFRSMIYNADAYLDAAGRPTRDRITRAGYFLRKLSLDELPQLINILVGQMSFVGPRPILEDRWERLTSIQKARFQMRPGITGLAQIAGRNEVPWSRRLELDLQYVREFSLLLDLRILLETVKIVSQGKGVVADRNPDAVDDLPATGVVAPGERHGRDE